MNVYTSHTCLYKCNECYKWSVVLDALPWQYDFKMKLCNMYYHIIELVINELLE